MPNIVKNVLAVLAGLVAGSLVNMALITIGPSIIANPEGVDTTTPEGLAAGIHLFHPRHFIMPFLAHALGTLVGALVTYLIAASHKARLAFAIGFVFLLGGVAAAFMIAAPAWFMALDLLVAYLPMAWLAAQIGSRMQQGRTATASA